VPLTEKLRMYCTFVSTALQHRLAVSMISICASVHTAVIVATLLHVKQCDCLNTWKCHRIW